jgi:hypothetical protein
MRDVFLILTFVGLTFSLLLLEASPRWHARPRLRAFVLFLFIANSVRIVVQDRLHFEPIPFLRMCLWECAEARHLALNALLQLTLFFLYHALVHP